MLISYICRYNLIQVIDQRQDKWNEQRRVEVKIWMRCCKTRFEDGKYWTFNT